MAQAKKTSGTQAIVAAERAGIAFTVLEYAHDPSAESYGLEAALGSRSSMGRNSSSRSSR
jgi:Cys-tRNA(Pro)/Cys-tRNA(Cys) deacylase